MIDVKIMQEIYKSLDWLTNNCKEPLDRLGILAVIGSYNDTMEDNEILDALQHWNESNIK